MSWLSELLRKKVEITIKKEDIIKLIPNSADIGKVTSFLVYFDTFFPEGIKFTIKL